MQSQPRLQKSASRQPPPAPPALGTVVVTLVNGSGGEVPADTTVTLYAFDNMQMAFTQTLTSGENGVYTFEDIEMLAERAFLAGVDYNGGTYGSDVATADPAVPLINLQITTYETSSRHICTDHRPPAHLL